MLPTRMRLSHRRKRIDGRAFFLLGGLLGLAAARAAAFSGIEGASFLDLPVGSRPAALGSAYTALADDAYAPTWNAAGLAALTHPEFAGMHVAYLEDTAYEFASFVMPLGKSQGIGVAAQYFRPGKIAGTDANANPIGDFGGHYGAYTLAYGHRITDEFSLGLSAKRIQAQIDDVSASATAADLGALYRWQKFRLAASLTNMGSKLKFLQEGDQLPAALHIGGAWKARRELTLALEGVKRRSGLASAHLGAEWMSPDRFSLRGGYSTDRIRELSKLAGLSVGIGLPVWQHEIAYTFIPLGDLGTTHYISFVMRFGVEAAGETEDEFNLRNVQSGGSYEMMDDMNLNLGDTSSLQQEQP